MHKPGQQWMQQRRWGRWLLWGRKWVCQWIQLWGSWWWGVFLCQLQQRRSGICGVLHGNCVRGQWGDKCGVYFRSHGGVKHLQQYAHGQWNAFSNSNTHGYSEFNSLFDALAHPFSVALFHSHPKSERHGHRERHPNPHAF